MWPIRLDFKIKFECEGSTGVLSVGIKYSMRDQVSDVINYSEVWKKLSVYDQIVIEHPKREGIDIKKFYRNFHRKENL